MKSDSPLWTKKYSPDINEFKESADINNIKSVLTSGVNCLIVGRKGVGKSALSRAISEEQHKYSSKDTLYINISDIFDRNKSDIKNDDRFSSFLNNKRNLSKNDMINEVLNEIASYPPVTGGFKTIILDNMESSRTDFQNSLRRTMEKNAKNSQFILTCRNNSIIPAIESRCQRIYLNPADEQFIINKMKNICKKESIKYDRSGLKYIWSKTRPNIRKAILTLQTVSSNFNSINAQNCKEVINSINNKDKIRELFDLARKREFSEIEDKIDDLIYENGYNGVIIIEELVNESIIYLNEPESKLFCRIAGEISMNIQETNDDVIEVKNLLAKWSKNV